MELKEWKEIVSKNSNFGKIFSITQKDSKLSDNEIGQFYNVLKRLDKIAKVNIFQTLSFKK